MDALRTIKTSARQTPQSEKARPEQVRNRAGGYVFKVGDDERARRFLLLGTEGGTFYASEEEHTGDNAQVILRMAASRPMDLLTMVVEMSTGGRAPRQNPCIFALAVLCAPTINTDEQARAAALAQLSAVCRTGTHLFLFARYVEQFRGWGPALSKAVGRWYTQHGATETAREEAELRNAVGRVAYQVVKYRQREGWTHRDMLRLSHPKGVTDPDVRRVLNWAVGKGLNDYEERAVTVPSARWSAMSVGQRAEARATARPALQRIREVPASLAVVADFEDAQAATKTSEWVEIVGRGNGLSWEMLPDKALNEPAVWEALLRSERGVPQMALIRQLPRLSRLGLCDGDTGRLICAQISDAERLTKARVHPINLLVALRTYSQGHGMRSDKTWPVVSKVVDTLSSAFPNAYGAVRPSDVRMLLGLDTSGSMHHGSISGLPLQPLEVCAALATVAANTESDVTHVGYDTQATRLDISAKRRLDDVMEYLARRPGGGTDCSLPMRYATANKLKVDCFVNLTDGESWYSGWGGMHPFQALEQYRQKMGINARLVTVAMTATRTSINRQDDALSLDVVGFDSSVPQMINDFAAGRL